MKETLQDAVVLVTGGAGGLGLALAAEAGRRGAKLMLADVIDAADAAAELRDQGVEADWVQVDMTDYGQVTALVERTLQRFGSLNILCNNAGIGAMGGLDQIDPGQAKKVLDVNILGYFHAIHACARTLKAAVIAGGPAFILNTGSEHSLGVPPHVWPISIYTTSKYAVLGLTDTARRDLGPVGVGVSLLAPGWVLTEKVRGHMAADERFAAAVKPYGQTPEAVARAAFDGLLAGVEVIFTNPVARDFALKRLQALAADIERLPAE